MITEFGKLLRIIRVNSGDSAKDMAIKLNMSPSYLSTIENGKRNIPPDMEQLLISAYNLSDRDNLTEIYKEKTVDDFINSLFFIYRVFLPRQDNRSRAAEDIYLCFLRPKFLQEAS